MLRVLVDDSREPAHTPNTIVETLQAEMKRIAARPDFQKKMADAGLITVDSARPDRLKAFIASEIGRWSKVVEQSGIVIG
jgi:tripartite-type tricarboxylate transporter receptor subunit TctC